MTSGIKMFLVALVVIVVALILAPIVISAAVTAATATGIGSFAGVAALIGLIPLGFVILAVWFVYGRMKGDSGGGSKRK